MDPNLIILRGKLNDATLLSVAALCTRHPPFSLYSFGLMFEGIYQQLHHQSNITIVVNHKVVAYAGWILVKDRDAQIWLNGNGCLPLPDWESGDAVMITIFVVDSPAYLRPLARAVSHVLKGKKGYRMRPQLDERGDMRRPPIIGRAQPGFEA